MMEAKIIAYVLIGIFLGPVASLAITPLFCLLRKLFYVPFIRKSFSITTLIISKKPGNTGISRDIRTEFTTDLLLSD